MASRCWRFAAKVGADAKLRLIHNCLSPKVYRNIIYDTIIHHYVLKLV